MKRCVSMNITLKRLISPKMTGYAETESARKRIRKALKGNEKP